MPILPGYERSKYVNCARKPLTWFIIKKVLSRPVTITNFVGQYFVLEIIMEPFYTTCIMIILQHNRASSPFQRAMNLILNKIQSDI